MLTGSALASLTKSQIAFNLLLFPFFFFDVNWQRPSRTEKIRCCLQSRTSWDLFAPNK